ncbi:MAG: 2-hydroxyacyl-CoA dehydratase [Deltaproteobacteria bacterium]|nr:2-hydroxyacyl-CoA dehydratase [Deltaproteobacteria bacterium]MBW2283214.1 2-hydroxyacyl-CoA dehydratase [Deltaproteobacteria bacterium]
MENQVIGPNLLKSVSRIGQMMRASFVDIKRQAAEGKKVVWANGLPAFLLARGAGAAVIHAEGLIAGMAARGEEKPFQEAAEAFGLLPDACSYARSFTGAALLANGDARLEPSLDEDRYIMPKPDMYINVPGGGCGTGRLWGDTVSTICDVPVVHLEPRFNWDTWDVEDNIQDFIRQEEELIDILEEITGRPYDWDLLKSVFEEVKRAITLRQEIMDICRSIPAPASFFDMVASIGPVCHLVGLPGTGDLLQEMKDEVRERVAAGTGSVPEEKYRLYWDGIMTWPRLGVLSRKFATLGACVIAGPYSHMIFLPRADKIDPDRPLESIAYNLCDTTLNYDYDHRVKVLAEFCRGYSIDGMIMSETQTCRGINSHTFAVMEGVGKALDVPAVVIGGDSCDPRFYSDAQVDTRLQALLETIDAKRRT